MKTIDTNAVDPVKSQGVEEYEPQVGSLALSLEQLEERASVKTALLREILANEETSFWHHGGLNE